MPHSHDARVAHVPGNAHGGGESDELATFLFPPRRTALSTPFPTMVSFTLLNDPVVCWAFSFQSEALYG